MDDDQQARGAVAVRQAIQSCRKCHLRPQATQPVAWHGPLNPALAVLGEAPGRTEDRDNRPFVGPAGQLLQGVLRKNGVDPATVTYLNSANCYPSKSKTPTKEDLDSCRVHLAGQLASVLPTHLLVVGTVALSALIGDHALMKAIRGRPLWIERLSPFAAFESSVVAWPTYHPAAALRSSAYRMKLEDDVKAFIQWINNKDIFPGDCVKCGKEVDSWDKYGLAWCANHSGKQGTLV